MSLDRRRIPLARGPFGVVVGQVVRLCTIASHKSGSAQSSRASKRPSCELSKHANDLSANEPRIGQSPAFRDASIGTEAAEADLGMVVWQAVGGATDISDGGPPRLSSAWTRASCCC